MGYSIHHLEIKLEMEGRVQAWNMMFCHHALCWFSISTSYHHLAVGMHEMHEHTVCKAFRCCFYGEHAA